MYYIICFASDGRFFRQVIDIIQNDGEHPDFRPFLAPVDVLHSLLLQDTLHIAQETWP